MLSNQQTAKQVSDLMLEIGAKLDASVALVQATSSDSEFQNYRGAVGKLMGTMFLDIMDPLYTAQPQLKPEQLK